MADPVSTPPATPPNANAPSATLKKKVDPIDNIAQLAEVGVTLLVIFIAYQMGLWGAGLPFLRALPVWLVAYGLGAAVSYAIKRFFKRPEATQRNANP